MSYEIEGIDPETKNKFKYKKVIPKWSKAYEFKVKSVTINKNPISAFIGLHILNTFGNKKNNLKDFVLFSKVLYAEKTMCDAYLNYGMILEKGILEKKNLKNALKVYEEGEANACNEGWKKQVIGSKIWYLKRKLK